MRRPLVTFALALVFAAAPVVAFAQAAAPGTPGQAPKSLDLDAIDKAADPCVNFYEYACGGWRKANPIPSDKARWGRFDELAEYNQSALKQLLEEAARPSASRAPLAAKVGDYYASCMDQPTIDARGLAPIQADLDAIVAAASKPQLAAAIGRLRGQGVPALFGFSIGVDLADSAKTLAQVDQGGTSLPERDYYLKPDPKSAETREKFAGYVEGLLRLAGDSPETAAGNARAILALETKLAQAQLDRIARRDPGNRNHRMTFDQLKALAPAFDFAAYLKAAAAPSFTDLNVGWPDFFKALDATWRDTPLGELKTYVRFRLLNSAASELSSPFEKASFEFFGGYLRGVKEMPPRWKRCVAATDQALGEALGQLYVEKTFGAEGKARMKSLVDALTVALEQDIRQLDWMTPETKARAVEKLRLLGKGKIGYPDTWRDYGPVRVARDDYAGNARRATQFEVARNFAKLGKPVDRTEWSMTPPTVNAYYSAQLAEIVFPAGILQPPFFDREADDAVNFGGIGAVIGHELTHGFDDSGRKFDGKGNLADWWTDADAKAFDERAACIGAQYGGYSPVKDPKTGEPVFLKPGLTMGENLGDNGGVRVAYMALMNTLTGKSHLPIDGYTPEQRFFLGFAQVWCQNVTDAEALNRVNTDPHSAGQFRANGPLRNMPEFEKAFSCQPGAPMAPVTRCRVW